jgi:hypothetical protein
MGASMAPFLEAKGAASRGGGEDKWRRSVMA